MDTFPNAQQCYPDLIFLRVLLIRKNLTEYYPNFSRGRSDDSSNFVFETIESLSKNMDVLFAPYSSSLCLSLRLFLIAVIILSRSRSCSFCSWQRSNSDDSSPDPSRVSLSCAPLVNDRDRELRSIRVKRYGPRRSLKPIQDCRGATFVSFTNEPFRRDITVYR